ncbi:MAG: T9SS type A sorting domain-containing protein [Bacteroidales bacterium]|nr:T9SS type A sorting domain-containing protein [Bacteroidales bacterium]MDY6427545.1 T9SS type A sorting domain-containing protein [Bacteroidales bacterium]
MKTRLFFMLCFVTFLCRVNGEENALIAVQYDGFEQTYLISSVGTVTFEKPDGMTINFKEDENSLGNVRAISFTLLIPTMMENEKDNVNSFYLFPNPVERELVLVGCNSGDDFVVYSISGQEMYRGTAFGDDVKIDVSSYSKGIYFVCVKNVSLKFIKR